MDINALCESLSKLSSVKKLADNKYEIITNAKITQDTALKLYLVIENDKVFLSDQKETLRFMNKVYELNAKDVKQCITDVVKHYKFQISNGILLAEIKDEKKVNETFFNYIMCIAQLVNMYLFFDKP